MCILCSLGDVPEGVCPDCGKPLPDVPYVDIEEIRWCSAECAAPYEREY